MRLFRETAARWLPVLSLAVLSLHCVSCVVEELFEDDPCTLHTGEKGICRRADSCAWLRPALRAHEITYQQLVGCGRVGVRPAVKACATYDGVRSQLSYHIVGGSEADSGEVPFIGALGYRLDGEGGPTPSTETVDSAAYKWACGSSLITPLFLVTAAHCISTPYGAPEVVRMGTVNLLSPPLPDDVQDRTIKNTIVHPGYKKSQKYNDIALVEVTNPFKFDAALQPTCLATEPADLDATTVLYAAGWGFTEKGDSPQALLRTNLSTVSGDECDKAYGDFKARIKDGIRPSQYCARGFYRPDRDGGLYSDTCEGDSGGPLYHVAGGDDSPKYYLLGVTSFGAGCGSSNPSVYTRISFYLDWIEQHGCASPFPPGMRHVAATVLLLVAVAGGALCQVLYEGDPCELRDGTAGVCTDSTACPWFLEEIVKKRRFADRVSCGFDGVIEVICCKSNDTVTGRPLGVRSRLACEQVPKYTSRLTFHIIDGEEASEGEFPFMAALGYPTDEETQNVSYRCGASLISADFLLTAAHCIPTNDRPIVAILGTNNLAPGNHGVVVGIKAFFPHPEYRTNRNYHDIALIQLDRRIENEPDVNPICLNDDPKDLPEDTVLTAEGYGIIDLDRNLRSNQLMKVNLTTVPWQKEMIGCDRWSRRRLHQQLVTLTLLTLLSGRILLLAANQILLEDDPMLYEGDACEMRNGTTGVCRPANQCEWVLERPKQVQELVTCSFNQSLPIVCCPVLVESRIKSVLGQRISTRQCDQFPNSTALADHIFNGETAQFGEFPYMAALGYGAPNGTEANEPSLFRCAASLISRQFLLTAAHCLRDRPVFVRLGVLELQPVRTVDEPLDIAIRTATLHPDYHPVTYQNDIAVIELVEPVPSEWPFIDPVCLFPNATTDGGGPTPEWILSVQGWGTQLPGDTEPASRLLKANVSLIEREECAKSLPRTRRNPTGLHPGQLCALGRNEQNQTVADTCPGDSGGPLELNVDGRHYLVGITSNGYACGSPIPGIYTEVARYLDWIESIPDREPSLAALRQSVINVYGSTGANDERKKIEGVISIRLLLPLICLSAVVRGAPSPDTIFMDSILYGEVNSQTQPNARAQRTMGRLRTLLRRCTTRSVRFSVSSRQQPVAPTLVLVLGFILLGAVTGRAVGDFNFPTEPDGLYEGDKCGLPGTRTGICRKAATCPQGIRLNGDRCEFSGNDAVVCCPTDAVGFAGGDGTSNRITTRVAKQECERLQSGSANFADHLSGRRLEADLGEFPFVALVVFDGEYSEGSRCGASLIAKRFLLTAAHCFRDLTPASVQLAIIRPNDPEKDEYKVREVHTHEDYRSRRNDIALIELERDVTYQRDVGPICLNTDRPEIGPSVNLTVMGWGNDANVAAMSQVVDVYSEMDNQY
uniref:Peptidase S1 domain-containing protein n=1 Tax=Anopheles epiroticus TaxID=199890 RepID=A0A182PQ56_9DIPT